MSTPTERKIKVLLAKSEMDAHDRGLRYVASVLRDAGMEVIFIRYRIVDEVVTVAMQEDVDVIGLSFYGSGLMHDTARVIELLKENKADDMMVIVGGTIPEKAAPKLLEKGVRGIFGPGDPIKEVISCISKEVSKA